jgi:hypothetical protein
MGRSRWPFPGHSSPETKSQRRAVAIRGNAVAATQIRVKTRGNPPFLLGKSVNQWKITFFYRKITI